MFLLLFYAQNTDLYVHPDCIMKNESRRNMKRDQKTIDRRHQEMVARIRAAGTMSVEELSSLFGISSMTCRRDLQILEEKGYLRRFRGGAAYLQDAASEKNDYVLSSRKAISRYAAGLLKSGDSLFINGSQTALDALEFTDVRLSVYTNNARAASLKQDRDIQFILTGGTLKGHILVGDYCIRSLLATDVDIALLGCTGISEYGEILCDIPSELSINETMLSHAQKYFILADSTKFGKVKSMGSFTLQTPGTVITDTGAPKDILDKLRDQGMEIILVQPAV